MINKEILLHRRELRDVVRNSKYKTKLCQKYWVSGYCAYGPRCNFLHDEATSEEEQELLNEIPDIVIDHDDDDDDDDDDKVSPVEPMDFDVNPGESEGGGSGCGVSKISDEPRSISPTNILDANKMIFNANFNEPLLAGPGFLKNLPSLESGACSRIGRVDNTDLKPMTIENAMAEFEHYL